MTAVGNELKRRLGQVIVPILCAAAIIYFGYHGIQGNRGLIAWWNLRYELEKVQAELNDVTAQHDAIEQRVSLLRPESLDRDMLEERARVMLGVVHPNDRIVPLAPKAAPTARN